MRKHLLSYRNDMRVEVEYGMPKLWRTFARLLRPGSGHDAVEVDLDAVEP
jgi:hypothetical protein